MQSSTRSRNLFRKLVVDRVNESKIATQNDCLIRLYYADSELKSISRELDSFDGKKDPVRCNLLVNQLRTAQDKVISLLFQLMDDCNCERASRDYRMKFPDEILLSEGSESLNGQIWFGAECLSAGSTILNHNKESTMLRPMAKALTQHLDSLRNDLRDLVKDGAGALKITQSLIKKMADFDHIFTTFEYEYVRTMLPIRTVAEIEKLQEVAVLFSETLIDCLKRGLIKQDDIDEFQPIVMIAIPRLAIVRGLLYKNENPIYTRHKSQMCSLFQPFHGPLHSIRKLLRGLQSSELYTLEKMLANDQTSNEDEAEPRKEIVSNEVKNDVYCPENESSEDHHKSSEAEHLEAGTSNGNYTNVLMDGLQYPVGHKRDSSSGDTSNQSNLSPSQQPTDSLECYLGIQASTSKSDVNACGSPSNNELNPSPSTSLSSPTQRKFEDGYIRSGNCQHHDNQIDNQHGGCPDDETECDTENFHSSLAEHDGQLEKLMANFSSSMNDNPESPSNVNFDPHHLSPERDIFVQSRDEKSIQTITEPVDTAATRKRNESEIEDLFQKQAQQLLHRLFVAISGVADQLQSNFASDLRFILRHIFSSEISEEDDYEGGDDDINYAHENAYDETYEDDVDDEGEYSNEQSDSSLPIEQAIEARETNLIDLESGYTLMDSIERAAIHPDSTTASPQQDYPFNNPSGPLEQHFFSPLPLDPTSHQIDLQSTIDAMSSSHHQANIHYNQTDGTQRILQNSLNQRQMNSELLADLMRATDQQNLIMTNPNQESPNDSSPLESSPHHQRLLRQHLQSVSRATNRIAIAAAAASVQAPNGPTPYGDPRQVTSYQRSSHGERRSRHHSSSRSRRVRGPPFWVPDQDVVQCGGCNAPFTLFRRRHHCRACGHIFCAECSKFTKDLTCWGYNGPVRVCRSCHNQA